MKRHARPPEAIFSDNISTGARLMWLAMWYDAEPAVTPASERSTKVVSPLIPATSQVVTVKPELLRTTFLTTKESLKRRLGDISTNTMNRWLRELRDAGWLSSADGAAVQAWDLHPHTDGRDPAPTREVPLRTVVQNPNATAPGQRTAPSPRIQYNTGVNP